MKQVRRLREILDLKGGEVVYDLGSGDGRVVIELARDSKIRAIGVERSFGLCLWARLMARLRKLRGRVVIKRKNMFKEDLREADVVVCYLFPGLMAKLRKKFEAELKPGAIVASFSFLLPDKEPFLAEKSGGYTILLYRF